MIRTEGVCGAASPFRRSIGSSAIVMGAENEVMERLIAVLRPPSHDTERKAPLGQQIKGSIIVDAAQFSAGK